jgi:hypothetical protein
LKEALEKLKDQALLGYEPKQTKDSNITLTFKGQKPGPPGTLAQADISFGIPEY